MAIFIALLYRVNMHTADKVVYCKRIDNDKDVYMPRFFNKRRLNELIFLFFIVGAMSCFASPHLNYRYLPATPFASKAKSIHSVLLVVAMKSEAAPIIHLFHLVESKQQIGSLPMKIYAGAYHNITIHLVLNGNDPIYKVNNVGSEAATLSAYIGISMFHPDLVISIGTAGGIAPAGATVGDLYISKKIFFYDRRMPGVDEAYGLGNYTSANLDAYLMQLPIKIGVVCSGDSFDNNATDMAIIIKHHCAAKEMEAASIAWVSLLMKVPMIAIKGVTDIVGNKHGYQQYQNNRQEISQKLALLLQQLLLAISKSGSA